MNKAKVENTRSMPALEADAPKVLYMMLRALSSSLSLKDFHQARGETELRRVGENM